ncbi:hypothetical protein ACFQ9X_30345 [Catenulispora yoronensis]
MTEIDSVQEEIQDFYNQRTGRNYLRLMDTPRVWGLPFGKGIMPQSWNRQNDFEVVLEEIVQKARFRCDISSLNAPDPDWGGIILGAMDTALSRRIHRTAPTQFRFMFGQTPAVPIGEPTNYRLFKQALVRLVRDRRDAWEVMPDIWLGRFYRLREGILSTLQWKVFGGDGIFASDNTKMTWNHTKIVAVDGVEALTGGHNLNMDLFRSYPPVHDVSAVVHGPAAAGAHGFLDQLWGSAAICSPRSSWTRSRSCGTAAIPPPPVPSTRSPIGASRRGCEPVRMRSSTGTTTIRRRRCPRCRRVRPRATAAPRTCSSCPCSFRTASRCGSSTARTPDSASTSRPPGCWRSASTGATAPTIRTPPSS